MEAFEIDTLEAERAKLGKLYLEFLRVPALSVGLYVIEAGGTDPQQPHTEDEVYYVESGAATVTVVGEERAVSAGSIVYVAANVEHRFHSITEELRLLVFFAPAEYTNKPG
ncbi:MAG: cupin domain-containing protein [Chloroflexota bacterium]